MFKVEMKGFDKVQKRLDEMAKRAAISAGAKIDHRTARERRDVAV